MDINDYLQRTLSQYALSRIYTRAGIELQNLTADGIIERGEVRYKRNKNGSRNGVIIVYQKTASDIKNRRIDEVEVDANETTG